jgi:hypothetical protein
MFLFVCLIFSQVGFSNTVKNYTSYVESLDKNQFNPNKIEGYHSIGSAHEIISNTVQEYPGRIRPQVIGHTVNRHPIWAFHVKDPMGTPEHRVLVFAGLHAMEWLGLDVCLEVLQVFAEHPPKNTEVIIVPWVNIDKRLLVEQDRIDGKVFYRRSNLNGVDLNRDYEINREATAIWRHLLPKRYTTSPGPLSQPESQAIEHLVSNNTIDAAISLHSFGGYLYYPWAALYRRVPDRETFVRLGQIMQNAQEGPFPYRVEQLTHWFFIFRIQGSEIDHLYGKYGIHAFLIELTYTGVRLFDPDTWNDSFYLYNPKEPQQDLQRGVAAVLALSRNYSTETLRLDHTAEGG